MPVESGTGGGPVFEVELEPEGKLQLASYAISLLMAAGACRVVTLCAHLTRNLLAIAMFLFLGKS